MPEDATAFAYRNGGWAGVIAGIDPDPANLPAATAWAQQYWEELHSMSAGGGYVNMMMEDDGNQRVRAAYRGNSTAWSTSRAATTRQTCSTSTTTSHPRST